MGTICNMFLFCVLKFLAKLSLLFQWEQFVKSDELYKQYNLDRIVFLSTILALKMQISKIAGIFLSLKMFIIRGDRSLS